MHIRLAPEPIDADTELAAFAEARGDETGAIASFVGYCRAEAGRVETLELTHYPGFTEKEIARMAQDIARRCAVSDLLVVHRVGAIATGEAIVVVAAASRHRADAFKAVEALMDCLKTDAPLWKREIGPGGARWIEPTADDLARRAAQEESR